MHVLNGNGKKVLEVLTKMGFSPYEARAYFTLLLCGEMKAGNVARMSGVPQPRVYNTLEGLADRNVVRIKDGSPKEYRVSKSLGKIVKSYVASRRNEIEYAIENGRWLGEIADAMAPIIRRHQRRLRVFEPKYTRG
jgi:sugar-specific transcriptional regulator TrmB